MLDSKHAEDLLKKELSQFLIQDICITKICIQQPAATCLHIYHQKT